MTARETAPMTADEHALAVALTHCTMLPGTREKRFVWDMAALEIGAPLTQKQRDYLHAVGRRYRRQLGEAWLRAVEPG